MMKYIIPAIFSFFLWLPFAAFAQEVATSDTQQFEARVVEVVEEAEAEREDGSTFTQQNLKLTGLEGDWKGQEIMFYGIGAYEVVGQSIYKQGQRVVVTVSQDLDGDAQYYVSDHVRRGAIYWLVGLFVLIILAAGTWKGLRALLGLVASFIIIMAGILPAILAGWNPVLVSIIGAFLILLCVIYITEGFSRSSHLAIASILVSLLFTGLFSVLFTYVTHLSGTTQEEVMYLVGLGQSGLNFQGLLLAAILIGAVGILDDVVISQISSVKEIKEANPDLSTQEVFKRALNIGRSHLGSMVNTLFLAYAGAALPLLLLFSLNQPPFDTFANVINNELIATEIVRTLVGSMGIALAMPVATFFAAKYLQEKKEEVKPHIKVERTKK